MTSTLAAGTFTAEPFGAVEAATFPELENDIEGRVLVSPKDSAVVFSKDWAATVDMHTGLEIEMKAAACGGGCFCATTVRIVRGTPRGPGAIDFLTGPNA